MQPLIVITESQLDHGKRNFTPIKWVNLIFGQFKIEKMRLNLLVYSICCWVFFLKQDVFFDEFDQLGGDDEN